MTGRWAGWGGGQDTASATPFDQPAELRVTAATASSITLEWRAPATGVLPAGYRLRYLDAAAGAEAVVDAIPHRGSFGAAQRYTVTGMRNGFRYEFRVFARAGTGQYGINEEPPLVVTPISPPSALRVTAVAAASVHVAWSPPVPSPGGISPVAYELHLRDLDAGGAPSVAPPVPFGREAAEVAGLAPGHLVEICLLARAPTGVLVPAQGDCARARPLAPPRALRVVDVSYESVALQWDSAGAGAAASAYRVVAEAGGAVREELVAHSGAGAHNLTLVNVSHSAVYRVQVFALLDGYAETAGSNALLVAPTGRARAPRLCFFDRTQASLQWELPDSPLPAPSRFRVSIRPAGCAAHGWQPCAGERFSGDVMLQLPAHETQAYLLSGLPQGERVELRVHVFNDAARMFEPVGTAPLEALPRGGRAEFALRLAAGSGAYALVAPAADEALRELLRPASFSLEAWLKLAVPSPRPPPPAAHSRARHRRGGGGAGC